MPKKDCSIMIFCKSSNGNHIANWFCTWKFASFSWRVDREFSFSLRLVIGWHAAETSFMAAVAVRRYIHPVPASAQKALCSALFDCAQKLYNQK